MSDSISARRVARATTTILLAALLLWPAAGCVRNSSSTSNGPSDQTAGTTVAADTSDGVARASDADRDYPLGTLPTTTVQIKDHTFRVWLAQEFDESRSGVLSEGLMYVRPDEIESDQGMLFVFSDERVRGFWMLNTQTPLDIAYARMNGTIVRIAQMDPLTITTHSSIEPAMFALEVPQGTFDQLGIVAGDQIEIPAEAVQTTSP